VYNADFVLLREWALICVVAESSKIPHILHFL
jgi:hypothetical protein